MKKSLVLMLTLFLTFSILVPASAQTLSREKQAIINSISLNQEDLRLQLSRTAKGFSEYTVNRLDGDVLTLAPELSAMQGAKLQLAYQLNTPEQHIGTKWKVTLKGKEYQGEIYILGTKIVFTKDVIQLIRDIAPDANVPSAATLPRYLYMDVNELVNLWPNAFPQTELHKVIPDINNLIAFFVEAIPDNCISKNGDKIVLSIDQQKLPQVLWSVFAKVKTNPDQFASLLAKMVTTVDKSQTYEEVKAEILEDIMVTMEEQSFPTVEELRENLLESGLTLNSLTFTTSEGVNPVNAFKLDLNIKANPTDTARLTTNVEQQRNGERVTGKFAIDLLVDAKEQDLTVAMNISGNYDQANSSASSDSLLKLNVINEQRPMVNFELKIKSNAQMDKNSKLEIPVLTPFNSLNIDSLEEETSKAEK